MLEIDDKEFKKRIEEIDKLIGSGKLAGLSIATMNCISLLYTVIGDSIETEDVLEKKEQIIAIVARKAEIELLWDDTERAKKLLTFIFHLARKKSSNPIPRPDDGKLEKATETLFISLLKFNVAEKSEGEKILKSEIEKIKSIFS